MNEYLWALVGFILLLNLVFLIYKFRVGKKRFGKASEIVQAQMSDLQVEGKNFSKEGWSAHYRIVAGAEESNTRSRVPWQTRMEFTLDAKVPLLSVRPKGRAKAYLKRTAAPEIEIGEERFDRQYVISTISEEFAKNLLDPATRELVGELKNLQRTAILHVQTFGHTASVTLHDFRPSLQMLTGFLQGSFTFADRLVSLGGKEEEGSGACLICGEVLVEKTVNCSRCQKAYHRGCWTYWGSCFARDCDETKSVEGRG